MSYYYSTTITGDFDRIIEEVTSQLKIEGFGILTQIDVQQTMEEKLKVNFNKYKILGACNPPFAYEALQAENKIGVMLPCNIIVRETDNKKIEVAAVNPLQSMQAVNNTRLENIAQRVSDKLQNVIKNLGNET
jgi:uncharacterized protein (DUF302 family)